VAERVEPVSGDVRTPPKFAATLSDDPAIREVQQYLLSLNSGLLNQTALAASDWRWAQVNASGTSTWALQYRTPPSTWTTIAYFGPTGTLSTAAGGSLPSGGTANQVLTRTATASEWANGSKATLTTTGDLLYASAANTPARLAAGTSGYVLTANGAGVAPSYQAITGAPWCVATKPATADSRDEEFEGTLSAWTLNAGMSATAPDIWSNPGAGVIRYSVNGAGPSVGGRPSHLVLQPVGDATYRVAIEKAVTFNTNDVIVFRCSSNRDQGAVANNDYSGGLLLGQTSGGALDLNNAVGLFMTETDIGAVDLQWQKTVAGVPTTATFSLLATGSRPLPEYYAIIKRSGDFYFYASIGEAWMELGSYTATGLSVDRCGVQIANAAGKYIQYWDFIRFFANTGNLP